MNSVHALKVLEFDQILGRLQQQCQTSVGASLADDLLPSFDEEEVWRLVGQTAEAYDLLSRLAPPSLGPVRDLREGLKRASKGGALSGQDLYAVAEALQAMRSLKTYLAGSQVFEHYATLLPDLRRLEDSLTDSLDPSGEVKDSASAQLGSLRQKRHNTTSRILERVQSYVSGKTRDLLSDPLYTVRDGRYVIPLKAENRGKIRGIVHDTSATGLTLFIEPEDVLQLGNSLREIESAEREEVNKILASLSSKVGSVASEVVGGIESAAAVDLIFAKARLAFAMKGALPVRVQGSRIEIQGGKHPLLEPERVIPLDIVIGAGSSVLITGPNTGGKTVAIKTVGLFVLMIQSGLFPPALDVRHGCFSQVWADIGDEQSLQQSLSTFSGHIRNISEALKGLKPNALALLDEIGAGTDPAEGAALAIAILSEMDKKGAAILASTHYGELKAFAYEHEAFRNAAMEFDPKTLQPTYRLVMGAAGASQALRIAERYGIPKEVVEEAREGLSTQHRDIAKLMEQLDQAQRLARQAQGEADRRSAELKRKEEAATKKLAEAEEIRRTAHSKAQAIVEEALREIRLEATSVFEDLKKAGNDPKGQEAARARLRSLQEAGQDFAKSLKPAAPKRDAPTGLTKGMTVKIDGYSQTGILLEDPKGKTVQVQVGPLKMSVALSSLQAVQPARQSVSKMPSVGLQKAQSANMEIHLRHMRAEDAERELEKFVDDAVLAGFPSVRIVHGKGEGVLRNLTRSFLRSHPDVRSYRDGEPGEGGHGVTIAVLK